MEDNSILHAFLPGYCSFFSLEFSSLRLYLANRSQLDCSHFLALRSLRIQGWACHIYGNNFPFVSYISMFFLCAGRGVRMLDEPAEQ